MVRNGAAFLRNWARGGLLRSCSSAGRSAAVWERLFALVQECEQALGMVFLDGTNIRAHHKAAGAQKKEMTADSETIVKRLAALAVAMAPRSA